MDTSVDHLFKNGDDVFTAGAVVTQPQQQQQDVETPTQQTPSSGVVESGASDKQKTKLVRY